MCNEVRLNLWHMLCTKSKPHTPEKGCILELPDSYPDSKSRLPINAPYSFNLITNLIRVY